MFEGLGILFSFTAHRESGFLFPSQMNPSAQLLFLVIHNKQYQNAFLQEQDGQELITLFHYWSKQWARGRGGEMKEHQCEENVQSHREALPGIMTQLPRRDQQLSKASQTLSRETGCSLPSTLAVGAA